MKSMKNSLFGTSDNNNSNVRTVKGSKTAKKNFLRLAIDNNNKKSQLSGHKSPKKDQLSKRKSVQVNLKSENNLLRLKDRKMSKDVTKNTLDYFSIEKKEDCHLQ